MTTAVALAPAQPAEARRRLGRGARRPLFVDDRERIALDAMAPRDLRETDPEAAVPAPSTRERCWRAQVGLWCPCGCRLPDWAE